MFLSERGLQGIEQRVKVDPGVVWSIKMVVRQALVDLLEILLTQRERSREEDPGGILVVIVRKYRYVLKKKKNRSFEKTGDGL